MSSNAPAVNAVTLVGNLTADPVLRTTDEHRKVCDLRLAVNDQKDQPPLFIDVATFGSSRLAWVEPALVIDPSRRCAPVVCSQGTIPR